MKNGERLSLEQIRTFLAPARNFDSKQRTGRTLPAPAGRFAQTKGFLLKGYFNFGVAARRCFIYGGSYAVEMRPHHAPD